MFAATFSLVFVRVPKGNRVSGESHTVRAFVWRFNILVRGVIGELRCLRLPSSVVRCRESTHRSCVIVCVRDSSGDQLQVGPPGKQPLILRPHLIED